jgi:enolase-phosphatase E1
MISFRGRGIVVDIEGTTTSIAFVTEVLFPFARSRVDEFLSRRWDDGAVQSACRQIATDVGETDFTRLSIVAEVDRLMAGDVKATGLKSLQGLIWEEGYAQGVLRSHVYPDVPPALEKWNRCGIDVRVYSSGSVTAQKSFFRQTEAGDLLRYFRGHYDTTTGPKRDARSYSKIANDMGVSPVHLLFLSDVPAELDAAKTAGWKTGLLMRPGNAPVPSDCGHPAIASFAQIEVLAME